MSINQRQFDQLTEMGISLWQHRSSQKTTPANSILHNEMNLNELSQIKLFNDILLSLNISIGEVTQEQSLLNLGLINWQFLTPEDKSKSKITFDNNKLQTPNLDVLSTSIPLKRQLWHVITHNIL